MSDDSAAWTTVAKRAPNVPGTYEPDQPRTRHEGVRRRYLNMVAEHLERCGRSDLGALGKALPVPDELKGSPLKNLLEEASDVFHLQLHHHSGWLVGLKEAGVRVAGSRTPHLAHLEKTVLCVEWRLKGTCARGSTCWFAHGVTEQRDKRIRQQHQPASKTEPSTILASSVLDPVPLIPGTTGTGGRFALLSGDAEQYESAPHPVHEGERSEQLISIHLRTLHMQLNQATDHQASPRVQPVAYMRQLWDELDRAEASAATALGYDKQSWECGLTPPGCTFLWSQLLVSERASARILGYSEESWNTELNGERQLSADAPGADDGSHAIEGIEHAETRSTSSADRGASQISCKDKVDALRTELGFEADLPMPAVVQKGFELLAQEPPPGGLVLQVCALYAELFEAL